MPKIADLRLIGLEFAMPEAKAYGMARGLTSRRVASIIEVVTADGIVGIGEAWGAPAVNKAYLDLVRPRYLGRDIFDSEHVWSGIVNGLYHLGLQNQLVTCVSGINVACWDAIGRTLNVPLAKLLGGQAHDRVAVYASGGYITHDPDFELERQLEPVLAGGFKAAKIKIGLSPRSDEERVRLTRRVLGPDRLITVDANGNYTVDLALESMRRIAPYDIHFYEEPLPPQDFTGYAELRRRAPMPIATGEALYTAWDFKRLIDLGGVDVLQPDISLCGGLDQTKAIALLGRLANLRFSPHVWGGAVGLVAAAHFAASLPASPHTENPPAPTLVEHDVGPNPLRTELLREELKLVDGELLVPTGPGLGVTLDEAAVRRYRTL